jgi:hypothetical protein
MHILQEQKYTLALLKKTKPQRLILSQLNWRLCCRKCTLDKDGRPGPSLRFLVQNHRRACSHISLTLTCPLSLRNVNNTIHTHTRCYPHGNVCSPGTSAHSFMRKLLLQFTEEQPLQPLFPENYCWLFYLVGSVIPSLCCPRIMYTDFCLFVRQSRPSQNALMQLLFIYRMHCT